MILSATRLSATGGYSGGFSRPLARTINFIGDSLTDIANQNSSATNRANPWRSFINWAMSRINHRAYAMWNPTGSTSTFASPAVGTYEFATFGAVTSQIITNHVSEITASKGDLVCILAGANDLGNLTRTSAETLTQIQGLVDALRAAGHTNLMICALTPRAAANNGLGSDGKTFAVRVQETNALLLPYCASQGIPFCNWFPVLADSSGFWNPGFSDDNVHFNTRGSQAAGFFLGDFILENYQVFDATITSDFLASLNSQSVTTTGWSTQVYSGSTVSASTVAGTDGQGDWRRLVVGNATPASTLVDFFRTGVPLPPAWGIVDGDLIQPVVEMRIESSLSNARIDVRIEANSRTSRQVQMNGSERSALEPFSGWFFGQPTQVNASSTVLLLAQMQGTPMTVDFRRIGFRKVNSMVPPYL